MKRQEDALADNGLQLRHEEIQVLAYHFWEQRGRPIGTPEIDWFRAEDELLVRCGNCGEAPPLVSAAKTFGAALGSVAHVVENVNKGGAVWHRKHKR
jgi:hypothetical protein